MKIVCTLLLVSLQFISLNAHAHQPLDGDIYGTGEFTMLRTHRIHNHFDSPYNTGFGVTVEGDLNSHGGLEISLLYIRQLYSIERNQQIITERGKRIYIATGYRNWFTPQFSAALSFFSSYSMSDAEIIHNDFGINNSPATSAQDLTEYGFDLSLQYEPFHVGRFSAVVDARYAFSVTPKPNEDSNFYALMLGIKYYIQARN